MRKAEINLETILCWLLLFLYIVVGNTLTFNIGNRAPLKVAEVISIPFILIMIIKYKKILLRKYECQVLVWLFIGFFSSVINSFIYKYSFHNFVYGSLYILRIIHLLLLTNLMCFCLKKNKINQNVIIKYIIFLYVILCLIGFFQLKFFPVAFDFYKIFMKMGVYFATPDHHVGRMISTYFDPNFLASCLLIPFAICLNTWKENGNKNYFLFTIFFSVSIILTISRSGFLGMGIIIIMSSLDLSDNRKELKKDIYIIILALLVLIIMFVKGTPILERILNSSSDGSTYARVDSWKNSLQIIKNNPIFGIGYNMMFSYLGLSDFTGSNAIDYGTDSSLLLIISTTGLVGIAFFLFSLINNYFKTKINKWSKKLLTQILFSALIICNFNNLLFYVLWLFPVLFIINIYNNYQ